LTVANPAHLFQCALVVEPVQNLRKIVVGLISGAPVERVLSCATPVEAVRLVETHRCDIALLSSASGCAEAFALAIRHGKDSPTRDLPIVEMSKLADPDAVLRSRDSGIDTILALPFSGATLTTRLRAMASARPPFIEVSAYVGPDRRRLSRAISFSDRRRTGPTEAAAFGETSTELLAAFIRRRTKPATADGVSGRAGGRVVLNTDRPAFKTGLERRQPEMRCTIQDLKPGHTLTRDCVSKTGLTIIGKGTEISDRSHTRLVDLLRSGEIENLFYIRM
jgi:two-component system chemotaxis response regulator CheY